MSDNKMQRYSISVSSTTYVRAREAVEGSLAAFVDGIVESALNDPAILARVASRCRPRSSKEA